VTGQGGLYSLSRELFGQGSLINQVQVAGKPGVSGKAAQVLHKADVEKKQFEEVIIRVDLKWQCMAFSPKGRLTFYG
jgi:hypothetical protein